MKSDVVGVHTFKLDQTPEAGSLILRTTFLDNGDKDHGLKPGLIINQNIVLQAGVNAASFNLIDSTLTPSALRLLADQIELAQCEAMAKLEKPLEK